MRSLKLFGYFATAYCTLFSIICLAPVFSDDLSNQYGWGPEQKGLLFILGMISAVTGALYFYFTYSRKK